MQLWQQQPEGEYHKVNIPPHEVDNRVEHLGCVRIQ